MKKKFLFIPLACAFAVAVPMNVHAEEGETPTEVIEEEVVDEKATALEQAKHFKDEWMPRILSAIFGASGTATIAALFWAFLKRHFTKVENSEEEAKKTREEDIKMLQMFVDLLMSKSKELEDLAKNMKEDFDAIVEAEKEEAKARGEEIDELNARISALKEVICQLVLLNPELMKNGDAQSLIEACDESTFIKDGADSND